MVTYLTEPATLTTEDVWAELIATGADPRAHAVYDDDQPAAACVHLLERDGGPVTFRAPNLGDALRRALLAWRRAEVLYARRRGLLPEEPEAAAMPIDTVRMAVAAAMALRELEH